AEKGLPAEVDYRDMLMSKDEADQQIGHSLYRDLTSMGRYYVTTNYDEWLEYKYDEVSLGAPKPSLPSLTRRDLVCKRDELMIAHMEQGKVVHLHGLLTVPKSLVITTRDYLMHYRNDRGTALNPVTEFLFQLFQKGGWTVLFVGYGMEEM